VLDRALGDEAVGVTRLGEHGAGALRVHEGHAQKQYKLRQVVEVVFDVHDDRLAQLLEQLKRLRDERREYEREVAALETFLREEEVPAPETLAERRAEIAAGRSEVQARLTAVTAEAMSSTDFAEDLRARYGRARSPAAQAAACVRDREALVDRCATGSPTSWTDAQSPTSAAAKRGHPGHAPLHGAPPPRAPLPHKVATPGSASGTRGREGPDHVQLPLVRQPGVAQRLGLVDAPAQRREDPLDRIAQLGRRRETHVGALQAPATLDPHRRHPVDHHLIDVRVAQQRLERPQPERPLGHARHERLARTHVQQRRLTLHQRPDPPLDVVGPVAHRLAQQPLAQRGG
jgi:hypothetical protein